MTKMRIVVDEVAGQFRSRIVKDVPKRTSAYSSNPEDLFDTRPIDVEVFGLKTSADEARSEAKNYMFERFNVVQ